MKNTPTSASSASGSSRSEPRRFESERGGEKHHDHQRRDRRRASQRQLHAPAPPHLSDDADQIGIGRWLVGSEGDAHVCPSLSVVSFQLPVASCQYPARAALSHYRLLETGN
jgi:hypothetical protein